MMFSIVTAPSCLLTNSAQVFSLLHILPDTCYFFFFFFFFLIILILRNVRCYLTILIFISLMISYHFFHVFLATFISLEITFLVGAAGAAEKLISDQNLAKGN